MRVIPDVVPLLAILLAPTGIPPEPQKYHVGTVTHGDLIWHGHNLRPPLRISVEYTANPDTIWGQVYINNHPLNPRRATPATVPTIISEALSSRRRALIAQARQGFRETSESAQIVPAALKAQRDLFKKASDLVDSVTAVGADELKVYWKDQNYPVYISLRSRQKARIGPPAQFSTADLILNTISAQGLIIVGSGVTAVPRTRVAEIQRECELLRDGKDPKMSSIKDLHAAEDIARPKPIYVLLTKGE